MTNWKLVHTQMGDMPGFEDVTVSKTYAMKVPGGCLVELDNQEGATSMTFVPKVTIFEDIDKSYKLVSVDNAIALAALHSRSRAAGK